MTEWLDQCISEVWHSHNSSEQSQDAALRMELRAMQNQNIMEASASGHILNHDLTSGYYPVDDGTQAVYGDPQANHQSPQFDQQAVHESSVGYEGMNTTGYGWSPSGQAASVDINSRDQGLWSAMLQAVSTCASSLAQHLATSCYEVRSEMCVVQTYKVVQCWFEVQTVGREKIFCSGQL